MIAAKKKIKETEALTEKVRFDLIRYANCWEDADVLLRGLNATSGGRFLSIGSAGDNSFSLLTTDPELVMAVDVSEVQLFLIELKKAAFRCLEYENVLNFLGFGLCHKRLSTFDLIKNTMPTAAKNYWETQRTQIEEGVIYQGKFENYFRLFRTKILKYIHKDTVVDTLIAPKSLEEQEQFYDKIWNSWKWKALFKIFFSRAIMGKYGRDKAFMNEVNVSVSEFMFDKAATHFKNPLAQNNYFLHFILKGNFGEHLPHYMRRENFEMIRSRLDCLQTLKGYAEDAFKTKVDFNYLNLSNIFEYMDEQTFKGVADNIIEHTTAGTQIAYWNLMVSRKLHQIAKKDFKGDVEVSEELRKVDKGFFYQGFQLDTRK